MNRPARLLIADFALTRLGVRIALEDEDVEICVEADDAEQAIRQAELAQPDICLVGSGLPGGATAAVRGILDVAPSAVVIVLAETTEGHELPGPIGAGAIGYVPGTVTCAELRRVVRDVVAKEPTVPSSAVSESIREPDRTALPAAADVTPREAEVLEMLRRGHSTADIAERLGISPVTVRRHTSDLVRKTGAGDRAALVRWKSGIGSGRSGCRQPAGASEQVQVNPRRNA